MTHSEILFTTLGFLTGFLLHKLRTKIVIRIAVRHVEHVKNMLDIHRQIRKGHISLDKLEKPMANAVAELDKIK